MLTNLQFARSQMGMSLMFHIIFAAIGMAMPLLMAIAEGLHLRTGNPVYLELSKRWATGTAVLFAVGAVSGTVISFELGLLWPEFMKFAGAIIGMPFSLEGFAFFTEAIFLGIFLYGRNRISPLYHWLSGVMVAVSGIASGIFVVTANAWMNTPAGFELLNGRPVNVNPIAAMLNPSSLQQVIHMTLAAYIATSLMVAAIHAFFLLRSRQSEFHRLALGITLMVVCLGVPLQILSGDFSARVVARTQPAKFAALEADYHTSADAPLEIGGIPNDQTMHNDYGIGIPHLLGLLTFDNSKATVAGLDAVPRADWPNIRVTHWMFDLMVGLGFAMFALVAAVSWTWLRDRSLKDKTWLLRMVVIAGPFGFIALEAGWMVTEVGRQPWVIYKVMRTADAVTPMPKLFAPFFLFFILYAVLAVLVLALLRRQFLETGASQSERSAQTGDKN